MEARCICLDWHQGERLSEAENLRRFIIPKHQRAIMMTSFYKLAEDGRYSCYIPISLDKLEG